MSEKPATTASSEESAKKINKTKFICIITVLAVFMLCAGFLSFSASYHKVFPNTYLCDTPIGGLTLEEIEGVCSRLAKDFALPETLSFSLKGETVSVSAKSIDLAYDWGETAKKALPQDENQGLLTKAGKLISSLFQDTRISPVIKYDSKKLNKAISKFAKPYETEPVDDSYVAENNKLVIKKGHNGVKVDKTSIKAGIEEFVSGKKLKIDLSLVNKRGKSFDPETLYAELSAPATDAIYEKTADGEIIITADKPKVVVDKTVLFDALSSDKEVITLSAKVIPARVTKSALEKALFSGVMGSWTSYFTVSNVPRTANVRLSAERVNDTVLMPGESFSYDKTVGPRTAQNGFKVAGVYINNKVEQGLGGGVCQTSSTLYSAVLYANLEIVSRTSHSLPVSYMPPGQDATIAEGYIDFIFKNNTDHPIKISATINGGSITCKIIGTPVPGQKVVINNSTTAVYTPTTEIETDPSIPTGFKKTVKGANGCAVSSSRTVYMNGKAVKTEPLTKSVYYATPNVITVNPEDKDTPPENLTEQGGEEVISPSEMEETPGDTPASSEPLDTTEEIIEI